MTKRKLELCDICTKNSGDCSHNKYKGHSGNHVIHGRWVREKIPERNSVEAKMVKTSIKKSNSSSEYACEFKRDDTRQKKAKLFCSKMSRKLTVPSLTAEKSKMSECLRQSQIVTSSGRRRRPVIFGIYFNIPLTCRVPTIV